MKGMTSLDDFQESSLFNQPNFGFEFLSSLTKEINKKIAKEEIVKIYKQLLIDEGVRQRRGSLSVEVEKEVNKDFKCPTFIFVSSPMAAQLAALILNDIAARLYRRNEGGGFFMDAYYRDSSYNRDDVDEVWKKIEKILIKDWEPNFMASIRNRISYKIWNETWSIVKTSIADYFKNSFDLVRASGTINVRQLGASYGRTVSYKNEFISFGIFEVIFLERFCIICELPKKISRNSQNKLHSEKNAAIEWQDGFGLYYWNGINVPKEWIIYPDVITREIILSEQNIEKRRCITEIIGSEKYFELLNIICIDEAVDESNNLMKLFRTKDKDSFINEFLFFLHVIDPSTKREYFISVPPSNDVHWAKAATFGDKKIQFRQGDVGLLNLETAFEKPIFET